MFRNSAYKKQQGNLYIIMIFIIVVVGFLATSLIKIERVDHDTMTKEQLGTQAWFLANAANEWALTKLYPLSSSSAVVASTCSMLPGNTTNQMKLIMPQLKVTGCSVPVTSCTAKGELNGVTYYQVKSEATCGSGNNFVQRVEDVWVKE